MGANCTASIAFGYPQRIFGVNPTPPRLRKCYDFLNFGHFALTGWEAVWYPESAEILCAAPLKLNTQHNRYVPFPADPMGGLAKPYVAKEKAIMIHLQPPASEGVTEPEL